MFAELLEKRVIYGAVSYLGSATPGPWAGLMARLPPDRQELRGTHMNGKKAWILPVLLSTESARSAHMHGNIERREGVGSERRRETTLQRHVRKERVQAKASEVCSVGMEGIQGWQSEVVLRLSVSPNCLKPSALQTLGHAAQRDKVCLVSTWSSVIV